MGGIRGSFLVVLAAVLVVTARGADAQADWHEGGSRHESRFSVLLPEIVRFPDPVRKAFAAGVALGTGNWAWTERVRSSKGETVARWDPSKVGLERITLLEKDGHPPTESETARFLRKQREELAEYDDDAPAMSERMIRVVRAMRFRESGGAGSEVRYRLAFENPDYSGLGWIDRTFVRVLTNLTGVVVVDRLRPGFVAVDLSLPEPVRLIPGIKIRSLTVSVRSDWLSEARTWLPNALSVEVDGGIWLFGSIARSVDFEFFDYENVGYEPLDLDAILTAAVKRDK